MTIQLQDQGVLGQARELLTGAMLLNYQEHMKSHGVIEMLQSLPVCHSRPSGKSVLELQCSAAAKEAACKAERNRSIMLKLMRSIYFLAKTRFLTPLFTQI